MTKPANRLSFALAVAVLTAAIAATWLLATRIAPAPPASPPLVSLEKMGHLVSLKMNYSDVIEFTEPRAVDIPWSQYQVRLGSTTILFVARGDCTLATDLRQARYDKINDAERTLTVVLPPPAPLQARINHAARTAGGSYFYAITDSGLQAFIPAAQHRTRAMNNVLASAQESIEAACRQPALLASAKDNAEAVLRSTLSATGWAPNFVWTAH